MTRASGEAGRESMELLTNIAEGLEAGDHERVSALVRKAIEQGTPVSKILDEGLIAGMHVVGERFRAHEIFLPEVLLAAKAMTTGMELLRPLLVRDAVPTRGKIVLGTVRGDLHDIGKNLVGTMLRGAGFEVLDLGSDVTPERFVDAVEESGASLLGMSALLTTTMPAMRQVVDLLEARGLRGRVRVVVGGAPLSEEYAREIGADAYGFDAAHAVDRVQALSGDS
jgi:5-methyltetrahydrofolate--homocysteine methyltransferase